MLKRKQEAQYYFFALSNFLAAFSGGMILGKGMGIINISFLKEGSILAFFVGTILGLILLQVIPKKLSEVIARWFSIFAGITSLILLYVFSQNEINKQITGNPAIVFFLLLSIRFGFWFFSRVLRASAAAGQQQSIAWVELGYYAGVICGLIIWKLLGFELSMAGALLLDALLQFSAGALDFLASHKKLTHSENSSNPATHSNDISKHYPIGWSWRLASTVFTLTIGIQVIIFSLAHHVAEWLGTYILAFFYFGVSLAAITYKKLKIEIDWFSNQKNNSGYAALISGIKNKRVTYSIISFFAFLCVIGIIIDTAHLKLSSLESLTLSNIILIGLIVMAAFLYEILALALLDRIGLEEKASNRSGMIIRTYGLMGIGAAIALWIFGFIGSSPTGLLSALVPCVLLSLILVRRRHDLSQGE